MRVLIIAASLAFMLAACHLPRPLPPQASSECREPAASLPPDGSLLFVTLRQADCLPGGEVRGLTDLRAPEPGFAALSNGEISIYQPEAWMAALEDKGDGSKNPIILFIHGYRVTNDKALATALKIRAAIRTDSPVIALTWPSYGQYQDYLWDEANAEWASQADETAILAIASKFPHIAHSMGNRLALAAMNLLREHGLASHVDHLIMASPDVDRATLRDVFSEGIGTPTTIYGSRRDKALRISWNIHGYPRGGDLRWWLRRQDFDYSFGGLKDVEVVDTTDIDHSLDGHSAFIDTPEGAADLCRVIRGEGPTKRDLAQLSAPANYYRLRSLTTNDDCRGRLVDHETATWRAANQ